MKLRLLLLVMGLSVTAYAQEKTVYIGPTLLDCQGVGPQKCLQIKEDPDADWEFFYDLIEGFEYEEGYLYELRVLGETVDNPPADASSLRYSLVEVVSKTPVEAMQSVEISALAGTSWALESYGSEGAAQTVLESSPITLEIDVAGQRVAGSAGCNRYSSALSLVGTGFSVAAPVSTMMACSEEIMRQEQTYLSALQAITTLELSAGQLILLGNGQRLVFTSRTQTAQPKIAGTSWALQGLSDGIEITLDISADGAALSGSAGCNTYRASLIPDGNSLAISPPLTTRKFCGEAVMKEEGRFLQTLEKVKTFELTDKTLVLLAEGERLEFRKQ